jgi:hypothetical protein
MLHSCTLHGRYDVGVHGPLFRLELMTAQELSAKWKWRVVRRLFGSSLRESNGQTLRSRRCSHQRTVHSISGAELTPTDRRTVVCLFVCLFVCVLAQTDVSQLHSASGSSKVIAELQAAGTGMGQRALASNSLRTATIVALEESEVRWSQ